MPKFIDLTGQKFNYLTVIERAPNKGSQTCWKCCCICGKTVVVQSNNLKSGGTKSCGCNKFDAVAKAHTKNEIGNRFGRLVARELIRRQKYKKDGKKNGNDIYYRCICDCGSETVVWGQHLRDGNIRSCGCLSVDTSREVHTTHGLSKTKEYVTAKTRKRKELMKKLDSEWTPEMEQFLRTLFGSCVVCGITEQEHQEKYGKSLHVDHVLPLSKGYKLEPGNATVLCCSCNSIKQDKMLEDIPDYMQTNIKISAELFELLWTS